MPVITVAKWDFERLVGQSLSVEDIMDLLPRVKCEVEEVSSEVISYEAPHDRPDLFSVEGLARAIRLLLGIGVNDFQFIDKGYRAYNKGVPKRPYVAFAIVEDLELDDEAVSQIMGLQEKLHITYGRDRRKASIGVYDLDKIRFPIYYELADPLKTRFTPLDEAHDMSLIEILEETEKGVKYKHLLKEWGKYPVLRDSSGCILAMPPIINSDDTKVTVDTKHVLIDSTGLTKDIVIDMVTIMATSIAERSRSRRIVFVETFMQDKTVIKTPRSHGVELKLLSSDCRRVLGVNIGVDGIKNCLKKMGYVIKENIGDTVVVEAPPYRIDVFKWVDVVEDIAMAIGYEFIGEKATSLPLATHPGRVHPLEYLSKRLRLLFIGLGFVEVANYMMSNPWIQNTVFGDDKPLVKVSNPKMEKYTCLRRWLTPGLLEIIKANVEKRKDIRVFEIGDVAIVDPSSETGACIERRVGYAISHDRATLTDSLAILKTLSSILGLDIVFKEKEIKGLLRERTASINIGDLEIGFTGEVHPETLLKLGIERPVVVGEIVVDKIVELLH